MKLGAIMNRFPQTITANDTLVRARDLMVWGGFHHLPVIEVKSHKLVGLLTANHIMQHQVRTGKSLASSPVDTVAMAMTKAGDIQTAGPDDSVAEAASRMAAEKIGCLPITEVGKLVGLVTTTDVLTAEVRVAMKAETHKGPSVGDIMTRDPQSVCPHDRLLDAAARMQQRRVRHLPVVDGDNRVIGILSDRDVRTAIGDPSRALTEDSDSSMGALLVKDAMSAPAVTTTADQSCTAVTAAFVTLSVSAVPVVDDREVLVGIVSYVDILRAFGE